MSFASGRSTWQISSSLLSWIAQLHLLLLLVFDIFFLLFSEELDCVRKPFRAKVKPLDGNRSLPSLLKPPFEIHSQR
jgi:hypothetical protein